MQATVTKARGDYEDSRTGEIRTGNFWKIEVDGMVIRRAGSKTKQWVEEHVRGNFGYDIEIIWK